VNAKALLKKVLPPFISDAAVYFMNSSKRPEWEYMPQGWRAASDDPRIKGWNVPGVLEAYRSKWEPFLKAMDGPGPWDFHLSTIDPAGPRDVLAHNAMMSYACALSTASRNKPALSMLDWGGVFGHYYLISRSLIPDLKIDYHCKDLPLVVEHGRTLLPDARFYADDSCLSRTYDFVVAGNSLQYSEDWSSALRGFSKAAAGHLFVTRLPVIHETPSYVAVQRPYRYGYDTEYLGWCLNRGEFLRTAGSAGLKLIREFYIGGHARIAGAPEQPESRGFLFSRS
jgi:putative methyltransferase (TIGR04325 family)